MEKENYSGQVPADNNEAALDKSRVEYEEYQYELDALKPELVAAIDSGDFEKARELSKRANIISNNLEDRYTTAQRDAKEIEEVRNDVEKNLQMIRGMQTLVDEGGATYQYLATFLDKQVNLTKLLERLERVRPPKE